MPFQSQFKPTSQIFDKSSRAQRFSSFVSRSAKEFKQATKQKMIKGPHTGRLYDKKRGPNFRRAHRASAPGQRPSPDTLTLVNAISDRSVSAFSSEVYIAEKMNPESGTLASDYGEILQTRLDRPIMDEGDVAEAGTKMANDGEKLVRTMI